MSLIEEGASKQVRMAHLAVVGSHSVNGVAALHTRAAARATLFRDFFELWPEQFNNKTNGITPRRWLCRRNPRLSALITEAIGDGLGHATWTSCAGSSRWPTTPASGEAWREVKRREQGDAGRASSAATTASTVDPTRSSTCQVKRIHEYKRQLLNVLHVIALYLRHQGRPDHGPSCRAPVIFGGKAAPGYAMAKLDHQAHQRGGGRGQRRPGRAQTA